jgi:hypothetical protein
MRTQGGVCAGRRWFSVQYDRWYTSSAPPADGVEESVRKTAGVGVPYIASCTLRRTTHARVFAHRSRQTGACEAMATWRGCGDE